MFTWCENIKCDNSIAANSNPAVVPFSGQVQCAILIIIIIIIIIIDTYIARYPLIAQSAVQ